MTQDEYADLAARYATADQEYRMLGAMSTPFDAAASALASARYELARERVAYLHSALRTAAKALVLAEAAAEVIAEAVPIAKDEICG